MPSAASRLRAMRRVRGRGSGRGHSSGIAYNLYVGLLLVPLVGLPVARGLALGLSSPAVLAALQAPAAVGVVGLVLGLLLAGLAWLGVVLGPVGVEPAQVRLLAETDLARHRALARPFLVGALGLGAGLVGAAAVLCGVLLAAGTATLASAVPFLVACAVFALVAAVVWLAGQAAEPRAAGLLGAVLAGAGLLGLLVPAARIALPWAWVAATWPSAPSSAVGALVPLAVVGVLAAVSTRPLLDRLRGPRLVAESTRWRSVRTAVLYGDVAHALGGLRARPSAGRRRHAIRALPAPWQALLRDLVGAARTPVRLAVGIAGLATATGLLALATTIQAGWLLAMVGAGLGYLSLGVVTDGFRHASEVSAAPRLYGWSTPALFVRHAAAPVAVVVAVAGVGLTVVSALGVAAAPVPVACVALLGVVARAYDSAKGPLPVVLLTPVPSPIGDLSSLSVSVWEADALLITMASGAAAVGWVHASSLLLVALSAAGAGLLLLALRRRLRRL